MASTLCPVSTSSTQSYQIQVRTAAAAVDAEAERADFVRPDIMMKGAKRARRASICALPQDVSEASRMRELTGGGTVWPLRRAATLDGAGADRLTELYPDGRHRQREIHAYTDDFVGAHLPAQLSPNFELRCRFA